MHGFFTTVIAIALGFHQKKSMMLQEFKVSVANALILENKVAPGASPKVGRPLINTASQHAMKIDRGMQINKFLVLK